MIYDNLNNIEKYKGIFKNLDIAIEYLKKNDLNLLNLGKNNIDGEKIYINKVNLELMSENDLQYEVHKKYLDIHIVLRGRERISIQNSIGDLVLSKRYDEKADYALYKGKANGYLEIGENNFMICMLDEPHKPGIIVKDKVVEKCIVKVLK